MVSDFLGLQLEVKNITDAPKEDVCCEDTCMLKVSESEYIVTLGA